MDYYDLIGKYFDGSITEDGRRTLYAALKVDEALSEEFCKLRNAIAVASSAPCEEDAARGEAALRRFKKRLKIRMVARRVGRIMGYAAAVALVVGAWFLSQHETRKSLLPGGYTDITAPMGQRVSVSLADGSEVALNPSTTLRVYNVFNDKERAVELYGEAYFKVKGDPQRPFIVKTEGYNVQVLGTEFNVCAYPGVETFEADLVSGSLYVYDRERIDSGLRLSPREKVVAASGKLVKERSDFAQKDLMNSGIYQFSGIRLETLVQRMELWYGVDITFSEASIGEETYSGKFRQGDNVTDILDAMKSVGKFDWRRTEGGGIELFSP